MNSDTEAAAGADNARPDVRSPSPSGSSVKSEFDQLSNGPIVPNSSLLFQKPECSPTPIQDSENSSRSSVDSHIKDTERIHAFRESRSRDGDAEGSSSDESELTLATSVDDEETSIRKASKHLEVPASGLLRPADAARGRLANIRRESTSSVDTEVAHERMIKATQKVSEGWIDFKLDEGLSDDKKRKLTNNLTEPISILTNAFLPRSCSPSPTLSETHKQCYSPSTQQIVRPNIPYSPSPSPTRSPTHRQRLMSVPSLSSRLRSQSPSPIAASRALKRRFEGSSDDVTKRHCPRTATSPLVTERNFPFPQSWESPHGAGSSMIFTTPRSHHLRIGRRESVDSLSDESRLFSTASNSSLVDDSNNSREFPPQPPIFAEDSPNPNTAQPSDYQMDDQSIAPSEVSDSCGIASRPLSTESSQTDFASNSFGPGVYTNPSTPMSSACGSVIEPLSDTELFGTKSDFTTKQMVLRPDTLPHPNLLADHKARIDTQSPGVPELPSDQKWEQLFCSENRDLHSMMCAQSFPTAPGAPSCESVPADEVAAPMEEELPPYTD